MNRFLQFNPLGLFHLALLVTVAAQAGCEFNSTTAAVPGELAASGDTGSSIDAVEPAAGDETPKPERVGVLLVSHGSRSAQWREMVTDIESVVRDDVLQSQQIVGIKSAFMEYTEPSIATQLKQFDAEECTDVIIVPLLLTVSSHSFDDIPTIAGQKADKQTLEHLKLEGVEVYKPSARVTIAPELDFPSVLEENVIRRVRQLSESAPREGVVLVAYGSEPYHEEWEAMMKNIAGKLQATTGIDCVEHSYCGHVASYKSEPTEQAIRQVLAKKEQALVVPLLVAVDENFQGRIIGGAVKNVHEDARIKYRHDAILPDENINTWIVEVSRKLADEVAEQVTQ